ncbi:glycosyltransferase [Salinivibrio sp. MA440]|uniref:glycosyltransferase n=1 Tax=Salinivibrio sp. MA440 TaxID=1909456 RepID=UPI001F52A8F7|nr:glycosyltransferase [Salinivibrio sp. MA440]
MNSGFMSAASGSPQETPEQVVVVLGMHRSGTSALAKALQTLGVSLSENLMGAGPHNPKGHWEDLDIVDINDRLLRYYQSAWFTPEPVHIDLDDAYVARLVEEAAQILKARIRVHGTVGFKDPRTSRLLPFWLRVFEQANINARFVYALRNPLDIARSVKARDEFSFSHSYILWLHHMLPNLQLLEDQDVYWVPFNKMLTEPATVCAGLQTFLALEDVNLADVSAFCAEFIDTSLCHSQSTQVELANSEGYIASVNEVNNFVISLAEQQSLRHVLNETTRDWLKQKEQQRQTLHQHLDHDYREKITRLTKQHWHQQEDDLRQRKAQLSVKVTQLDEALAEQSNTFNKQQLHMQHILAEHEKLALEHQRLDERHNDLTSAYAQLTDAYQKRVEERDDLANENAQLADNIATLAAHHAQLTAAIESIQASTSWKLTAPVRYVGNQLKVGKQRACHYIQCLKSLHQVIVQRGGPIVVAKKAWYLYRQYGFQRLLAAGRALPIKRDALTNYQQWVALHGQVSGPELADMAKQIKQWSNPAVISVLMPVYNPDLSFLSQAIESVKRQVYPHWELCVADDCSTNQDVLTFLREQAEKEPRIRVIERQQNGHISAATNSALSLATGAFIALMDQDDLLTPDALYHVASVIQSHTETEVGLIYSDEDKIAEDSHTRFDPHFKSTWNPALLCSMNYISHLGVYRTSLAREVGGFREGYEGAQDWDFALRVVEHLSPQQIIHIPRVLYHWRAIEGSTATGGDEKPYALYAGVKAVQDHLERLGRAASVDTHPEYPYVRVTYQIPRPQPLVSLVIPTRNGLDVLKVCIDSILEKTTYANYEILIVDNGSDCEKTLAYLAGLQTNHTHVRVLRDDSPFNYSALNNKAVAQANGELVALVNNDIEVISPDWLTEMVGHALQPNTGAVGARLWYPDDTLQHGGVVMVCGVAGHAHKYLPKGQPGYMSRAAVTQNFSAVTAACLVIKKSIFQQVGGLNEKDLTVAFNDVDFCLKVQEAGYFNVWTPFAELYHYESKTRGFEDTPEKQARFKKEVAYMQKRWQHVLLNDPCYNPNLTMTSEDFSLADVPRL